MGGLWDLKKTGLSSKLGNIRMIKHTRRITTTLSGQNDIGSNIRGSPPNNIVVDPPQRQHRHQSTKRHNRPLTIGAFDTSWGELQELKSMYSMKLKDYHNILIALPQALEKHSSVASVLELVRSMTKAEFGRDIYKGTLEELKTIGYGSEESLKHPRASDRRTLV